MHSFQLLSQFQNCLKSESSKSLLRHNLLALKIKIKNISDISNIQRYRIYPAFPKQRKESTVRKYWTEANPKSTSTCLRANGSSALLAAQHPSWAGSTLTMQLCLISIPWFWLLQYFGVSNTIQFSHSQVYTRTSLGFHSETCPIHTHLASKAILK